MSSKLTSKQISNGRKRTSQNTAFGVAGLSPFEAKAARVWDGSLQDTAKYLGCSVQALGKVLKREKVQKAIRARDNYEAEGSVNGAVARRRDRQAFWTKIMNNAKVSMRERLRASELLGKSECDFIEKKEVKIEDAMGDLIKRAKEYQTRQSVVRSRKDVLDELCDGFN